MRNVKSRATLIILTFAILCIGTLTFAYLSTLKTATWSATIKSADLAISSETLDFGELVPGETANVALNVTNTGDITLTVSFTGTGGDVTWTLPDPFALNPNQEIEICLGITVDTTYTTSGGSLSGTLEIVGEQIP